MSVSTARARFVSFIVLTSLISLLASSGTAQQKPAAEEPEVLRITSDLVQTSFTVFDKQGRFVDGLTPEQFELRVEGDVVPISFFERVRAGSAHEPAQTSLIPRDKGITTPTDTSYRGRTVVFFIDDLHLSLTSVDITRRTLQRFLTESMQENDQVAIASASGRVGFLQQFTDNKTVLRAAIDRLKYLPVTHAQASLNGTPMSEYMALTIERKDDLKVFGYFVIECLKRANVGPKSGPLTSRMMRQSCETQVKNSARMILQQSAMVTLRTYDALVSLMRTSEAMSGSKLVFFISDGFLLDTAGRGPGTREKLDHITDAARRSGAVIYSIDAKGLSGTLKDATNNVFDADGALQSAKLRELPATQDTMHALASETGGRALRNQNTYDAFVNKVLEETSNYYLLAWRPSNEAQKSDKFKRFEISVVGRPDLAVRAARGFYSNRLGVPAVAEDIAPGAVANKRDDGLLRALTDTVSKKDLPIKLTLAYLDTPNNGALLVSSMQTDAGTLAYGEESNRNAALDLGGFIVDTHGKSVGTFKKRLNVAPLNNDPGFRDSSSVIYNHRALIKPGIYQVRVAARDDRSGRVGSARQWIDIPDLNSKRLTLSSLLLDGKPVVSNEKNVATDTLTAQVQFSVDRRFKRGTHLNFLTFIYNAARGASDTGLPDLEAQIKISRAGQPIVTTARKVQVHANTDLARIIYGADIALQALPPGRYLLQVTISDRVAKSNASQQVTFEIE